MPDVNVKDKLALDTFKPARQAHIKVDQSRCKACRLRACLSVCPARVYTVNEQQEIAVEFEACLECGTCTVACPEQSLSWDYPPGGAGVQYKYG